MHMIGMSIIYNLTDAGRSFTYGTVTYFHFSMVSQLARIGQMQASDFLIDYP